MAGHLRTGLLRDRDDGHRRPAVRHRTLWHGALFGNAATGRPDDRRRPGQPEDGAGAAPDLRPDGRAQMGAVHGCLRIVGRNVQQLRDRPGRRPCGAGGHLPARLPAASGDAAVRNSQAARQDSRDAARRQPRAGHRRGREGGACRSGRRSNTSGCCDEFTGTRPQARSQRGRRKPSGHRHPRHLRRRADRRAPRHVRRSRQR